MIKAEYEKGPSSIASHPWVIPLRAIDRIHARNKRRNLGSRLMEGEVAGEEGQIGVLWSTATESTNATICQLLAKSKI